jgi:hypothetical protein
MAGLPAASSGITRFLGMQKFKSPRLFPSFFSAARPVAQQVNKALSDFAKTARIVPFWRRYDVYPAASS